jgi:hypothetical protein
MFHGAYSRFAAQAHVGTAVGTRNYAKPELKWNRTTAMCRTAASAGRLAAILKTRILSSTFLHQNSHDKRPNASSLPS